MYICAGEIESFSFARSIGIGLEDVAIRLSELVMVDRPEEITFVGSAGSYGDREIFEVIESSSATQIEHSLLKQSAYSPIENKIVSHETDTLINSSNYITTDDEIAKLYLKMGLDLENMEFYAVLKVAKYFDIKAKGIFVVTNYCDKDAHRDFKANHDKGMKLLEEYIGEK